MNKVLLIGGTDPSGAGLQVDWKVINTLELMSASVVTAVTAQNSSAVHSDGVLPYAQIKAQFESVGNEPFAAIKIGMLGNEGAVKALAHFLSKQPADIPVILDPVLTASSGGKLLNYAGKRQLLSRLLPYVTLLTPNIDELSDLTGMSIKSLHDIETAAQQLIAKGAKAVLVKGGHQQSAQNQSIDTFVSPASAFYLAGQRWPNGAQVRGTGCVLATAIASFMAKGYSLVDALVQARALVSQGIKHALEDSNQQQFVFHFTKAYSGDNFTLQHLPELLLKEQELGLKPLQFASCESKRLGVYPVVDSVEWIKKLVPLGVETIQLRIKDKAENEVEQSILEAIKFCKDYPVRLFINDYWRLALKHNAYGVHLGQEDLYALSMDDLRAISESGCRLGLSTHSWAEVARAHAIKPSYLALGPIFATTSKDMPWIPQGVDAVKHWVGLLGDAYPLVAIGGIDLERARALKQTGVGSVAMISAITDAEDYEVATQELLSLWEKS